MKNLILFALGSTALAGPLFGQNLILNPSFESVGASAQNGDATGGSQGTIYDALNWEGEYSPLEGFGTTVAGAWDWSDSGPYGGAWQESIEELNTSSNPLLNGIVTDGAHGSRFGYIGNNLSELYQDITTVIGQQYLLTGVIGMPERAFQVDTTTGGIGGVTIGGQVAATMVEGDWNTFAYNFTATSTTSRIELNYVQHDPSASSAFVVDNLSLTAVPEASTALFAVIGSVCLLGRRKRA